MNYLLESRMREICTYGSEGGETGQPVFPTPIGGAERVDWAVLAVKLALPPVNRWGAEAR